VATSPAFLIQSSQLVIMAFPFLNIAGSSDAARANMEMSLHPVSGVMSPPTSHHKPTGTSRKKPQTW
jgi:hypothetical protein